MITADISDMDNSIQYFRISRLYESFVPAAGGAGRYFFMLDIASDVARWSPEAVAAFDLPGEFVKNNTQLMRKILSERDAQAFEKDLEAVRRRSVEKKETVWKIKNGEGEYTSCQVKYFTVRDYAGMPAYLAAAITGGGVETNTDPTISLPDQRSFLDHLRKILRDGGKAVVLLIGTSDFIEINSLYGYNFGNRVLTALADNLKRLGGDRGKLFRGEGTMLFFVTEQMSVNDVCRIYREQKTYAERMLAIDDTRVSVHLSAGVVAADKVDVDVHSILACARYARNRSETEEDGAPVILDNDYPDRNAATLELVNAIRGDVEAGCRNFSLHYQPTVTTRDGKLIGCEAFLRWECDKYGSISPADFLLWLEDDSCFVMLGNWILERAVREGKQLVKSMPDLIINVNLAQRQLEQPRFHQVLLNTLKQNEMNGKNLCIELTDRCRNMDPKYLLNEVMFLKSCGLHVALDGSCLLDLRLVRNLPVDVIKVGRDFTQNLKNSEKDRALLSALGTFAARTDLRLLAEGVEDARTLDLIREGGVYAYQGYLVSQPIPFEAFLATMKPEG